jgi:hypothetical protein
MPEQYSEEDPLQVNFPHERERGDDSSNDANYNGKNKNTNKKNDKIRQVGFYKHFFDTGSRLETVRLPSCSRCVFAPLCVCPRAPRDERP